MIWTRSIKWKLENFLEQKFASEQGYSALQNHVRSFLGIFTMKRQDLIQDVDEEQLHPFEGNSGDDDSNLDQLRKSVFVFELMKVTCLTKEEIRPIVDDIFEAYSEILEQDQKETMEKRQALQFIMENESASRCQKDISYDAAFPALLPEWFSQPQKNLGQKRNPLFSNQSIRSSENMILDRLCRPSWGKNKNMGKENEIAYKKKTVDAGKENEFVFHGTDTRKRLQANISNASRIRKERRRRAVEDKVEEPRCAVCKVTNDEIEEKETFRKVFIRNESAVAEFASASKWISLNPLPGSEQSCWSPDHVTECGWWLSNFFVEYSSGGFEEGSAFSQNRPSGSFSSLHSYLTLKDDHASEVDESHGSPQLFVSTDTKAEATTFMSPHCKACTCKPCTCWSSLDSDADGELLLSDVNKFLNDRSNYVEENLFNSVADNESEQRVVDMVLSSPDGFTPGCTHSFSFRQGASLTEQFMSPSPISSTSSISLIASSSTCVAAENTSNPFNMSPSASCGASGENSGVRRQEGFDCLEQDNTDSFGLRHLASSLCLMDHSDMVSVNTCVPSVSRSCTVSADHRTEYSAFQPLQSCRQTGDGFSPRCLQFPRNCRGLCNCSSVFSVKQYQLGAYHPSHATSKCVIKSASDSNLLYLCSKRPVLLSTDVSETKVHPKIFSACPIQNASEQQKKKLQEGQFMVIDPGELKCSSDCSILDLSVFNKEDHVELSSEASSTHGFLPKAPEPSLTTDTESNFSESSISEVASASKETSDIKPWKNLKALTEEDMIRDCIYFMAHAARRNNLVDLALAQLKVYEQSPQSFAEQDMLWKDGSLPYKKNKERARRPRHPNKPCSFYLEGCCYRSDCKFSHDISSITCHFWEEGQCFKGYLCPFLHGYVRRSRTRPKIHRDTEEIDWSEESFPKLTRKERSQSYSGVSAPKKRRNSKKNTGHHLQ